MPQRMSMLSFSRLSRLEWRKNLKDNDVDILRRCCLEFRERFRDDTEIDPFEKCLTIALACNQVYRTNYLQEIEQNTIDRLKDKHEQKN